MYIPNDLSNLCKGYSINVLLSFFSYALFDMDGNQVPQELVTKVGEAFESILEEACLLSLSPLTVYKYSKDNFCRF